MFTEDGRGCDLPTCLEEQEVWTTEQDAFAVLASLRRLCESPKTAPGPGLCFKCFKIREAQNKWTVSMSR